ncbi:hypothetical protein C0992_002459 [Termitomyces sp. T32_za158]|nr:hypothetical protein C0992_002459 [Termitomyces sp. T32_za158]
MLSGDNDKEYFHKKAREKDEMKLPKRMKEAQMHADAEKVAKDQKKQVAIQKQCKDAATRLVKTGKKLVLDISAIDQLSVKELDLQLDWHCKNEKCFKG